MEEVSYIMRNFIIFSVPSVVIITPIKRWRINLIQSFEVAREGKSSLRRPTVAKRIILKSKLRNGIRGRRLDSSGFEKL